MSRMSDEPSRHLGKMPSTGLITPSKISPWWGDWSGPGRFSRQQLYSLGVRGLDPDTVEAMTVRRFADVSEWWWGGRVAPHFAFLCPVVGRRSDGKIYIIAPVGDRKLIHAHGWVNRVPPRRWEGQEAQAA